MLDLVSMFNLLNKYTVNNGNVYLKENNQQILDEDIIMQVRSAYLIYNEARNSYKNDLMRLRGMTKDLKDYLKLTMEKFSVNNEVNSYGINKLINSLLNSNGHYEEMIGTNDLSDGKFSMFDGQKKEYGLSYLKMKFREKGLDIDSFILNHDISEFKKNGVSKVTIDFRIKPYIKQFSTMSSQRNNNEDNQFEYEQANKLRDLEVHKKEALKNNDEVAASYYDKNIINTLKREPIKVSASDWDLMDYNQKRRFMELKIKESKVLNDIDSFKYWQSNLMSLDMSQENVEEKSRKL